MKFSVAIGEKEREELEVGRLLLIDGKDGERMEAAAVVGGAVDDDDDDELASTGFLERFLPLCMCLSQYLESG